MAVLSTIFCLSCKRRKSVAHTPGHIPTICSDCEKEEAAEEKRAFLEERVALSVEERLQLLESDIYDLRQQQAEGGYGFSPLKPIGVSRHT